MVKPAADAVQKIESLPPQDQEVLGRFLTEHFQEVLDEARWEHLFAQAPGALDEFAAEVDEAIARGEVTELDPDDL